jgi:hypothetical protein
MSNVTAWPNPTGRPVELPRPIVRPCEYGLQIAVHGLESQLGTIEAYNRLVAAANHLRQQIDAGNARPQNPLFSVSVRGQP